MRRVAALALLAGCSILDGLGGRPARAPDAAPGQCTTPPCREVAGEFLEGTTRDLDLLFVIDRSGSMVEEQIAVTNSFYQIVTALESIPGGLPNLHLGVISTDVSIPYNVANCSSTDDDGLLQNTPQVPGCTPPSERWISDVALPDGTRSRNYTGALADAFECIARLGTGGCGWEQQLEAVELALDGTQPDNDGFLRAGAFLAVVIVSDEDDCSADDVSIFDPSNLGIGPYSSWRCAQYGVDCMGTPLPGTPGTYTGCEAALDSAYLAPPSDFATFLRLLRDQSLLYVSVIAGPPSPVEVGLDKQGDPELLPSCTSALGDMYGAAPGLRFKSFVDEFPNRGTMSSICEGDFAPAMALVGDDLADVVASRCLAGLLLDGSPEPGLQPDCRVYDVTAYQTAAEQYVEMAACQDDPAAPCYQLVASPVACPYSPGNLAVVVTRDGAPPDDTTVVVQCFRP